MARTDPDLTGHSVLLAGIKGITSFPVAPPSLPPTSTPPSPPSGPAFPDKPWQEDVLAGQRFV